MHIRTLAAASLLTGMIASVAGAAEAPRTITLQVDKSEVTYGQQVTLSGVVAPGSGASSSCAAGVIVTIRFSAVVLIPPPPAQWNPVGSVITDAAGRFTLEDEPQSGGRYVATVDAQQPSGCDEATSNTVSVSVRQRVTVHVSDRRVESGEVVRFSVDVDPGCRYPPPANVLLQRRQGGRFVKVASREVESRRCAAVFEEPVTRTGVYRGYVASRGQVAFVYLPGQSRPVRVRTAS